MSVEGVTLEQALELMSLPRVVGLDGDGVEITAQNGRYGPYLKRGTDSRSLDSEDQIFSFTLEEALAVYAQPKQRGRAAAKPPLKELGPDPVSGRPMVVKDGRFGAYVTDGELNATLRRGDEIETLTPERGAELLAEKRAKGPAPAKRAAKKAAPARKAAAGKSATTKASPRKTPTAQSPDRPGPDRPDPDRPDLDRQDAGPQGGGEVGGQGRLGSEPAVAKAEAKKRSERKERKQRDRRGGGNGGRREKSAEPPTDANPVGPPVAAVPAERAGHRMAGQRFYDLPYSAPAPRLVNPELGLHNLVARAGHNAAYEIDVTLLDAPDHRLIRSGVLLAHRVLDGRGEWFLTAPDWQPLLPKDRIELMGHADLPEDLADLIRPLRRRATLGPVAALNCDRREFALRDDRGSNDGVVARRQGDGAPRRPDHGPLPRGDDHSGRAGAD